MIKSGKQRIIFSLLVLLIIGILFFWGCMLFLAPKTAHGPKKGLISSSGIFKQGGWISFSFEPAFFSIKGKHAGIVTIEPLLSDKQKQKGLLWLPARRPIGKRWGKSVSGGFSGTYASSKNSAITISPVSIDIPDNAQLAEEKVPISVRATFRYPKGVGYDNFVNQHANFGETLEIFIEKGTLTSWEKFHHNIGDLVAILAVWLVFGALAVMIKMVPSVKLVLGYLFDLLPAIVGVGFGALICYLDIIVGWWKEFTILRYIFGPLIFLFGCIIIVFSITIYLHGEGLGVFIAKEDLKEQQKKKTR
ncbi:MAG: hypothetical protein JW869_03730 [Candidatus Omnitrophica bacterium]|nr:hypothetical protein [Candidatus Omnitrophota bacterium]